MTPDQLKEHFNVETQTALAAKLGKPISTVAEWFQKGRVPRAVQLEVELDKLRAQRSDEDRAA